MEIDINADEFERDMRELQKVFKDLPEKVEDYLFSAMSFSGARVFTKELKSTTGYEDRTGRTRKRTVTMRIDTRVGNRILKDGAALAIIRSPVSHLLDKGTVDRKQTTTGRATGKVDARNLVDRAYNAGKKRAERAMVKTGKKEFGKMVNAATKGTKLSNKARRSLGG